MNHSFAFNWIDYAIFSVIFISMLISFLRGFVKEAISLFIWLAAIIVALKFASPVGDLLFSPYESYIKTLYELYNEELIDENLKDVVHFAITEIPNVKNNDF